MQLEHSLHAHEDVHKCNAKGNTKHIHDESVKNCSFLHSKIDFNFTFELASFVLMIVVYYNTHEISIINSFSLQANQFLKLRAPPFSF